MIDGFLSKLYNSRQTVFTSTDVALLTGENNPNNLKRKLSYYVKTGDILRLRRGVFAKNRDYDRKELATRIYTPAYVSFETILRQEGMIFQFYESIFVVSYLSREISFGENKIVYRKLKNEILVNPRGIVNKGNYFEAIKERAFLDMIYLYGDYYFDNLRGIDWKVCFDMVSIYKKKSFEKKLNEYFKKYAK